MKQIFVNLKRFDVPAELGGVNCLADMSKWAERIIEDISPELKRFGDLECTVFFPEAHLLNASRAVKSLKSPVMVGCQGVFPEDVASGQNFGAFTTGLPAAAAMALGCSHALIGHCEERKAMGSVLAAAGVRDRKSINSVLNKEILCAQSRGMKVLYCVGESADEQDNWRQVIGGQLKLGLENTDPANVTIGYEPLWSIGPGKTPAGREYIMRMADYIKDFTGGCRVVYGGGLKAENAAMLASIDAIDGGLVALTRFSGEIGFYPSEFLEIVRLYMEGKA